MSHQYMLDTNTVSVLLRQNAKVIKRIVETPLTALCMSVITESELLYGLAKRPDASRLHAAVHELLRRVDVLPWSRLAAQRYGTVRAGMENKGKVLAPLDMQIASHALGAGAALVTNDRAFKQVPGLALEDWTV